MRPSSAIADLLVRGRSPAGRRGRAEYSSAGVARRVAAGRCRVRYHRPRPGGTTGGSVRPGHAPLRFWRDAPARGPGARGPGRARDPAPRRTGGLSPGGRGLPVHRGRPRGRDRRRVPDRARRRSATSASASAAWSRPPSGSPRATTRPSVKPGGSGLDGRLAAALNAIAGSSPRRTDRGTFDRLTGVANRQSLLGELFAEVERASRYERPLSVAFVDIDHFKAVNDTYGHAAGDVVLRGVAQTIAGNLRASDLIGRYGGEEFMLLLTETGVEEGAVLTEKLRTLVQRQRYNVDGNPTSSVTISIGIAGGAGHGPARGLARPRRRRRDVLGQGARAQPDLHLRRARRRRPRPARPDLGRPAAQRAMEVGQQARDAADRRPHLGPRARSPTTAASRRR